MQALKALLNLIDFFLTIIDVIRLASTVFALRNTFGTFVFQGCYQHMQALKAVLILTLLAR